MTAMRQRRYSGSGGATKRIAAITLILYLGSPLTAARAQDNALDKEVSAKRAAQSGRSLGSVRVATSTEKLG